MIPSVVLATITVAFEEVMNDSSRDNVGCFMCCVSVILVMSIIFPDIHMFKVVNSSQLGMFSSQITVSLNPR